MRRQPGQLWRERPGFQLQIALGVVLAAIAWVCQASVLVTDLEGEVLRSGRPLALLAPLNPGDILKLGSKSHIVVAYPELTREFRAQGPADFRVERTALVALGGAPEPVARELPAVYRQVKIDTRRLGEAGVRLRSSADGDALEPAGLLAQPARTFRWSAVRGAEGYVFRLADQQRNPLYEARLQDTALTLPETIRLKPGHRYYWQVEATGAGEEPRWAQFRIVAHPELGRLLRAAKPEPSTPRSEQVLYGLLTERPLP